MTETTLNRAQEERRATKFPPHITMTAQEAADALDRTQYTVLREVLNFYSELIRLNESSMPNATPDDHRRFALAAVWVAGHVQGMLERDQFAQRVQQAAEDPA